MKNILYISIVLVIALPALSSAQYYKPVGEEAPAPAYELGLSNVNVNRNSPWAQVIPNNEVGVMYCNSLSKQGLGLGPTSAEILAEIQNAQWRLDPENRQFMQPSLRMEKGRIKDTYFHHEVSPGGPETTSTTTTYRAGNNSVQMESGSAEKSLSVKVTYYPTMESKVFTCSAKYSSDNIQSLSYERAFRDILRRSGLPSLTMAKWEQSNPKIRRGLVCVFDKLWPKADQEMFPAIKRWMAEVSVK